MSDSPLTILESAISDVGCWSWWSGDPTSSIQLEFSGVQLWFPPAVEGGPPSGQVALRFIKPSVAVFVSRTDDSELCSDNWPTRFQADEIGGFTVGYDTFTMTDAEMATSMIAEATHKIALIGELPQCVASVSGQPWIAFWAGPVGAFIVATELDVISHQGSIRLAEIEAISGKWWEYWRDYWNKKDSPTPLPRDYACEVTIPLGSE